MSEKMVCPECGVFVSVRSYHKHISRNRCNEQHRDKKRRTGIRRN